jgi:prepilin-type N-terminal cleavage/methylation domain-containing protein
MNNHQPLTMNHQPPKTGFTLIEILVVVAIVALLAAILIPVAGNALKGAYKRRALVEMNSIKMAVLEFQRGHKYMPWGDPNNEDQDRVGEDVWTQNNAELEYLMRWLTGENPLKKAYLTIPEKSQDKANPLIFVDPWGQYYRIGMDRNLDGAMLPNDPDGLFGGSEYVRERVLVYSLGPETPATIETVLKTFDVPVP